MADPIRTENPEQRSRGSARGKREADEPTSFDAGSLPFYDFFVRVTCDGGPWHEVLEYPFHLSRMIDALDTAAGVGDVRTCVSCPPQHGKTTTILIWIVWMLLRNPKLRIAYVSYATAFSEEQSRLVRDLYIACGGKLKDDFNRIGRWKTAAGGGFLATSPEGVFKGHRANIIVCDDLYKDRAQSESIVERDKIDRWWQAVTAQRLWVKGSVVVVGSRDDPDDQIGRLLARGYSYVNLSAIDDVCACGHRQCDHSANDPTSCVTCECVGFSNTGEEQALWPDVKGLDWLRRRRDPQLPDGSPSPDWVGEFEWQAAYQGRPVPRAGAMFFGVTPWIGQAKPFVQTIIGVDAAFAEDGDWFSAIVMSEATDGRIYLREMYRHRRGAHEAAQTLLGLRDRFPEARMVSYVYGGELGWYQMLFETYGISVERLLVGPYSKAARAQATARDWKQGLIVTPLQEHWAPAFVHRCNYFTGRKGGVDDEIDAMVAGRDAIAAGRCLDSFGMQFTFGSPGAAG